MIQQLCVIPPNGTPISVKQKLRRSPTDLLPLGSCFSRLYSIFKLRSGYDIWYYVLGVAYTKYHNARPRPDTSTLQPVPESLIVFTKSQGLYVPASIKTLSTYTRKVPLLLHKKCNNCRNVAKLKDKSFVCTSLVVKICAVITQNYYRNIDESTRKNSASMQLSHNFNLYQYMRF